MTQIENFRLEQRGDSLVVVYDGGGVRPASMTEAAMWQRIRDLEHELSRVGPGPRIVTLEEVAAKLRGGEK